MECERRRQAELAAIERVRAERLTEEIRGWCLAQDGRAYIFELRDRASSLPSEDGRELLAGCDWAETWIEASDPSVNLDRVAGLVVDARPRAGPAGARL